MNANFEFVPPNPASLIQSMRSIGYDLPTAVADIIDNSISASAKNVWVNFYWNAQNSYISILDDGTGMTEEELTNAMRLGSISPDQYRNKNDLGRFGLGLKTASFSQCKKLTVISKKNGNIYTRSWDLEFIVRTSQWNLLKEASDNSASSIEDLKKLESGTAIILESLDRITSNMHVHNERDHDIFLNEIDAVKNHLAMVFHKFLERPNGLKIWINEREIKPWDPYLTKESATQNLTEETLQLFEDKVIVKPYILPHISKITEDIYRIGAGPKGWNAQQGFYVYRNSRMLVYGDWLGLGFLKEEHYKLARIMLDIPATMDEIWGIDVKKSRAYPPADFRQDLKRIARLTREKAVEIYRHRGKIITRETDTELAFTWDRKILHGKVTYSINRNHPLIRELLDNPDISNEISRILRVIEETLPIATIIIDSKEHPIQDKDPYEGVPTKELLELANKIYEVLLKDGINKKEAKNKLLSIEPFNLFPGLVNDMKESEVNHV